MFRTDFLVPIRKDYIRGYGNGDGDWYGDGDGVGDGDGGGCGDGVEYGDGDGYGNSNWFGDRGGNGYGTGPKTHLDWQFRKTTCLEQIF
jgi:hypothetical protein